MGTKNESSGAIFGGLEVIGVGSNLEKRRRACGLAMALEVASKPESKWPKFCQSASNATSIGVFKMLLASVLSSCASMESVATETLLFEEPSSYFESITPMHDDATESLRVYI